MPDSTDKIEGQKRSASMANPVDYTNISRFYANHVQVNTSLFEIRLVMNFVAGINPENSHLMAMETMFLSLSPELAKALHNLLGRALENYKREYGDLRVPEHSEVKVVEELDKDKKRIMDMTDTISPKE